MNIMRQFRYIVFFLYLSAHLHAAKWCGFDDGKGNVYDLSSLRITSGGSYEAPSPRGDGFYFINVCGDVAQGSCSPHQAVCQVGDAPHGCGSANDFAFSVLPKGDEYGVRLTYSSGEYCQGHGPRKAYIDFRCDLDAVQPTFQFAREENCEYYFEARSIFACPVDYLSIAEPINIFVVIHSHDDVGWLNTMQGYYDESVNNIITDVVDALHDNPLRKFIQVEQAFFYMWWNDVTDDYRAKAREVINSGQLSFVIGGWVMPDEATPSYNSLIDQLTIGHQFIYREFNATPTVGWQIDPFGASSALTEIYKLSGFKGHVIDRINFRVKNEWQTNKKLQFLWKLSNETDDDLLTHVLDTNYCYPFITSFKFTSTLGDQQIKEKAQLLVDIARNKARFTRTPNVLIPIGCDFAYDRGVHGNAHTEFEVVDRLIAHIMNNTDIFNAKVQYSDLADYFDALHESRSVFPSYSGDLFPYNDKDDSWWTGYYTSRPAFKRLVRVSESVLRASESLYSSATLAYNAQNQVFEEEGFVQHSDLLLQAISVAQHHDAISGTEKMLVLGDYNKLINEEMPHNEKSIASILDVLSAKQDKKKLSDEKNLNVVSEYTFATEDTILPVVVYNSLAWARHDYVKVLLPTTNSAYEVLDTNKKIVKSQQIPNFEGLDKTALFFKVVLPPLGFETYSIKKISQKANPSNKDSEISTFTNNYLKIDFSDKAELSKVKAGSTDLTFEQQFMLYESFSGKGQSSGAYIFRPDGDAYPVSESRSVTKVVSNGDFVSDMYQVFECKDANDSFVKQHVRVFHDDDEYLGNFLELSQTVGPIPNLGTGRELITRFYTSLITNTSYTDNNGFHFLERAYQPDLFLPIPGNYYPTVYASYVKSNGTMIGFVFDRAHGFSSSFRNVEIMLHRRCLRDDARGLGGDHLDDATVIDPVIRVVFGDPQKTIEALYRHMYLLNFPPVVAFGTPAYQSAEHTTTYSILNSEMPSNVHILNFKSTQRKNEFLFRLIHLFGVGEHASLSLPVTLAVHRIFAAPNCIEEMTETTLTANKVIRTIDVSGEDAQIKLKPKEIRTFVLRFASDVSKCKKIQPGPLVIAGEQSATTEPDKPTTQPDKPTTQPDKPTTQPNTKPEKPTTQPEKPTTQPEKPTTQPDKPTTHPTKPTTPAHATQSPNTTNTDTGDDCVEGYAFDGYQCVRVIAGWEVTLQHVFPTIVVAYLLLACAFGMRQQFNKLNPTIRTKSKRGAGWFWRVEWLLRRTNRVFEDLLFPEELRHAD